MLRITRAANGEVVFRLSERIDAETNGRRIVLDLKDLTLVDREAVIVLAKCEGDSVHIINCPRYIREWIRREPLEREQGI